MKGDPVETPGGMLSPVAPGMQEDANQVRSYTRGWRTGDYGERAEVETVGKVSLEEVGGMLGD